MAKLWCYIDSDPNLFSIPIEPDNTIHDVKVHIHKYGARLQDTCSSPTGLDLTLIKVRYIMSTLM
jgi:hypothetical protein